MKCLVIVTVTCPQGLSGGTTVAATIMTAERAGVPIFVTGGLGGVHRGGENSEPPFPRPHPLSVYVPFQVWM